MITTSEEEEEEENEKKTEVNLYDDSKKLIDRSPSIGKVSAEIKLFLNF
jgi:hypothetical protein